MHKTILTGFKNKLSFLTADLQDEQTWMRTLRIILILYAINFLLFLPIPFAKMYFNGENFILFTAIYSCIFWIINLSGITLIMSEKSKYLKLFLLMFSFVLLLHFLKYLPSIHNRMWGDPPEFLFQFIIAFFFGALYLKAGLAFERNESSLITGILFIMIGITCLPAGLLLASFLLISGLINNSSLELLILIISNLFYSLYILAFIGLFVFINLKNPKSFGKKVKLTLFVLAISIIIFIEMLIVFYSTSFIFPAFTIHLYIMPVMMLIFIFIIGLSIYKLEYKNSSNYLKTLNRILSRLSFLLAGITLFVSCSYLFFTFFRLGRYIYL